MAQLEVITFPVEFEVGGINDACACCPGNHFLGLSCADLEIVIEKASRIDWHAFPTFADVLDREIREFDFLAGPVFYTRPVRSLLFRRSMSAAYWTGESQHAAEQEDKRRVFSHVQDVCELFGNDGSDSSSLTQGNLSSSQIALCGANGAGSSSDAIVTSIVSESLVSSKNKCVRNMQQKSESDSHARSCVAQIPKWHTAHRRCGGNRCNDNRPEQKADFSTLIVSRRKRIHQ